MGRKPWDTSEYDGSGVGTPESSYARTYGDIGGGTTGDFTYVMDSSHTPLAALGINDLAVFESLNGGPWDVKFMLSMEDDLKLAKMRHAATSATGEYTFTEHMDVEYYWVAPDGESAVKGVEPAPPNGLYKSLYSLGGTLDIMGAFEEDHGSDEHSALFAADVPYESTIKCMTLAMIGIPRTVLGDNPDTYILPANVTYDGVDYSVSQYHVGFLDTQDRFRYSSESAYYGFLAPDDRPYGQKLWHAELPDGLTGGTDGPHRAMISATADNTQAGSWPSFRNYYTNAWKYGIDAMSGITTALVSEGAHEVYGRESLHTALFYCKHMFRQRWTSCYYWKDLCSAGGDTFDNEEDGGPQDEEDNEAPATYTFGTIPKLKSLGGVFTHDYYGPLDGESYILKSLTATEYAGEPYDLLGDVTEDDGVSGWMETDAPAGTAFFRDQIAQMPWPHAEHGYYEVEEDTVTMEFRDPAVVLYGSGYASGTGGAGSTSGLAFTKALGIRYETTELSIGRANEYLDFYTALIESEIVEETLPREYKTKMQAAREIKPQILSAIVGTTNQAASPPSSPTTSTSADSTPSTSMGETY